MAVSHRVGPTAVCALVAVALVACGPGDRFDPASGAPATWTAAPLRTAYVPGRVMARARDGASLHSIARDHGLAVTRGPGKGDLALLAFDDSAPPHRWVQELSEDDRLLAVYPVGATGGTTDLVGTASGSGGAGTGSWQLAAMSAPNTTPCCGLRVAVLDTGVAYEDYTAGGVQFVTAPSLAGAPMYAPWDFVGNNSHANDDHQHGTLMTSLVASHGGVDGVAPNVGIIPIKVLGADNSGDEVALIDGILHAVDRGADVISMSLAFGPGYVPSPPLLAALQTAADADVVLVAAAGNNGAHAIPWPAASPLVIAVGASTIDGTTGGTRPASYSNYHPAVDVVTPGGDVTVDDDGDGQLDGVVSESILHGDPSSTAVWLSAGTSQAAALTAGAITHLLAAGATSDNVRLALQAGAHRTGYYADPFFDGYGGGAVDVAASISVLEQGWFPDAPRLYGGLLPFIKAGGNQIRPTAEVAVVDSLGVPVPDALVLVSLWGSSEQTLECRTDAGGRCTVMGGGVAPAANGVAIPYAWAFSLDGVAIEHAGAVVGMVRPHSAIFASDALEVLVSAMQADPGTQDAMLAFYWDGTPEPSLGSVAAGYTVIDTGSGFATSPIGITFTPSALTGDAVVDEVALDLDGTGLADSPIGTHYLRVVTLDGTGLADSPIGLGSVTLGFIDGTGLADSPIGGTGLASSPIGLGARAVYTGAQTTWDSSSLSLDGDMVSLETGDSPTTSLLGTALGGTLSGSGWNTGGYPGATALVGASAVDGLSSATNGTGFASSPIGP